MAHGKLPLDEMSSCMKLWLLAGELLRDDGIEDVNAHHLATLLGQALTWVAVHDTIDPLDKRTIQYVISRAEDAANDGYNRFMEQVRRTKMS
jgi:hypothetical protein